MKQDLTAEEWELVLAIRRNRKPRVSKPMFTYFALSRCRKYLKIGTSANPDARVRGLYGMTWSDGDPHWVWRVQTPQDIGAGVPYLLGCLPGGFDVEQKMHRRYAQAQIAGEWFSTADPEVAKLCSYRFWGAVRTRLKAVS